MGFLKGSQMLQQNCEQNKLHTFFVFPGTVNILTHVESTRAMTRERGLRAESKN